MSVILSQGYRSLMGISVVQSCETALYYYQKAAKKGTYILNPLHSTLVVTEGLSGCGGYCVCMTGFGSLTVTGIAVANKLPVFFSRSGDL